MSYQVNSRRGRFNPFITVVSLPHGGSDVALGHFRLLRLTAAVRIDNCINSQPEGSGDDGVHVCKCYRICDENENAKWFIAYSSSMLDCT